MVQINPKKRNRIFAFFVVAFILCLSVVPAFAADPSPSVPVYASLPFDYVSTGSNIIPWFPFVSRVGATVDAIPGAMHVTSVFDMEFYLGFSSLTFYTNEFLFTGQTTGVFSSPYDNVRFSSARIRFNVMRMERSSATQQYKAVVTDSVDLSLDLNDATSFDLAKVIRDEAWNPTNLIFISGLEVQLNFYSDNNDIPTLDFQTRALTTQPSYINWLNTTQNMYYTILQSENIDFNWLTDSVNSVLELKIAPDMSINTIFYVVLVIGIVFWLITMAI